MFKQEWNEIGPAWWKIPFHLTYKNFGNSNRKFWSNGTRPKSVQVVADNSTVEPCSLSVSVSVGAKELKTCRSLVEANYATVKSDDCFTPKSNDSLHFQMSSLPVEANNSKSVSFGPADSTVEFCFLFVEAKELKKNWIAR